MTKAKERAFKYPRKHPQKSTIFLQNRNKRFNTNNKPLISSQKSQKNTEKIQTFYMKFTTNQMVKQSFLAEKTANNLLLLQAHHGHK